MGWVSVFLFYFFILPLPLLIDKVLAPYVKIVQIYIYIYVYTVHPLKVTVNTIISDITFIFFIFFILALMIDKHTQIIKIKIEYKKMAVADNFSIPGNLNQPEMDNK